MPVQATAPIVRSPISLPPLPETDLTSLVLRHSPRLGDRPALVDAPSGRTTLGEAPGATPFAALLEGSGEPPEMRIDPDDTAALLYSSGTTGVPKGVQLSHRAIAANIVQTEVALDLTERDTLAAVAPFFHALGFTVLMHTGLACGATIASLPRFDLEAFLRALQDHRATATVIVPPIALALARHPVVDRYDLSSLRFVGCGAAPLGRDLEEECEMRLGCSFFQGYGMTEATPAIGDGRWAMGEPERNLHGQAGILLPGTEARVVDPESGADRGASGTGEIWVRGPQLMTGYLGRPEATAETIDADGWLHTGGHRPRGRRGPRLHHRPDEGADQVQGVPGRPRRARGAPVLARGDRRRRGDRRTRRGGR
jgi:acyl-CoA synthetase (AMP-forming)/AMP-acid ligase II